MGKNDGNLTLKMSAMKKGLHPDLETEAAA